MVSGGMSCLIQTLMAQRDQIKAQQKANYHKAGDAFSPVYQRTDVSLFLMFCYNFHHVISVEK